MAECIEWTKGLRTGGYGQLRHEGKTAKAHRVAYVKAHGLKLADIDGQMVLHSCDNRKCVNPEHLRLGTHDDNMKDVADRNRRKGAKHPRATLTDEVVAEVKALVAGGATQAATAKRFSIDPSVVSRIVNNKTWGGTR